MLGGAPTAHEVLSEASASAEASAGRENPGSGSFQGCLAKSQGSTPGERRLWLDGIYDQIRQVMPLQGNLSIKPNVRAGEASRASFYRPYRDTSPVTGIYCFRLKRGRS
jgi:hypothetical protein